MDGTRCQRRIIRLSLRKIRYKIGEQDYNYTVDGPKSKDAFTYYSWKSKRSEGLKETSYTVIFFPTKSKEVAILLFTT